MSEDFWVVIAFVIGLPIIVILGIAFLMWLDWRLDDE